MERRINSGLLLSGRIARTLVFSLLFWRLLFLRVNEQPDFRSRRSRRSSGCLSRRCRRRLSCTKTAADDRKA